MILHTLNKAPSNTGLTQQLCAACDGQDGILLLEDGVYFAINNATLAPLSQHIAQIYVLADDARARGITPPNAAQSVSYADFIELCTRFDKVVSWY